MKKNVNFLFLIVVIFSAFFSCKSDLDLDQTLKFSKLDVEDQKQKIEDSGIQFIEIAEGISDTKAFKTIIDFEEQVEVMFIPELSNLKSAMINTNSYSILKLQEQINQRAEDEMWGEYTWNASIDEFEKTSESNGDIKYVLFYFPADENDSENNATFKITYDESNVEIPDENDTYFPEAITIILKAYDEVLIKGEFTSKFETDNTPSEMKSTLNIEDYSWNMSMTNNREKMSEEFSIKYKKDVLMKITSNANGNFDYRTMENAEDPSMLLDNISLLYQVMDVAILGGTKDMDVFYNEIENIEYENTREYYEQECEVINRNVVLYAYFTDKNRKFADVEFYVNETSNEWEDYRWNGSEYELVMQKNVYYDITPRMILSDGSKVDLEDYFENGFEELSDKIESSIEEYN